MALFCAFLLVAAILYICGEFLHADMGVLAGASRQQRFVASTVMILLTISLLPLSLRLFRFGPVHRDLVSRQAPALRRWGTLRMVMLGMLLVVNTFLYYAFELEASYGYLAVVTLLCMPFVIPTMSRCEAEVQEEQPQDSQDSQDSQNSQDSQDSQDAQDSQNSQPSQDSQNSQTSQLSQEDPS